jgi:aspartyl-tRNA(Asn)/glutamyl-tRNA(Gln) amidotransferase subunit C
MAVDRKTLLHTAELARLDLTVLPTAEVEALGDQFARILDYVALLEQVDVTGVEATIHPVVLPTRLRDDVAAATPGAAAVLSNSPVPPRDGRFVVPRVVDGGGDG